MINNVYIHLFLSDHWYVTNRLSYYNMKNILVNRHTVAMIVYNVIYVILVRRETVNPETNIHLKLKPLMLEENRYE